MEYIQVSIIQVESYLQNQTCASSGSSFKHRELVPNYECFCTIFKFFNGFWLYLSVYGSPSWLRSIEFDPNFEPIIPFSPSHSFLQLGKQPILGGHVARRYLIIWPFQPTMEARPLHALYLQTGLKSFTPHYIPFECSAHCTYMTRADNGGREP